MQFSEEEFAQLSQLQQLQQLQQQEVGCPYCGESIEVLLDVSDAEQEYIEDCQVCCRPIVFSVSVADDGQLCVDVRSEDDAY